MTTAFVLVMLAGLYLAWDWWCKQHVWVTWPSACVCVPLPEAVTRRAVQRHLEKQGCRVVPTSGLAFSRGCSSIKRIRSPGELDWREVPIVIGTGIGQSEAETMVHLLYSSQPGVRVSPDAAAHFMQQAAAEFDELIGHLQRIGGDYAEWREWKRGKRHSHRWMPEDDAGAGKQARRHDASHDADLALLGLERGATLEQVKKAYRVACRKYHPDGLTGQNVEPYLVELAVQRFKEVSAAHQRLCEHFAQRQHA
ncbi:MAG: hypothetical protein DPW13_14100 [Planctomycetes bacterium]|nr:hypothetical protein [Planctomycetota bacterium]